VNAFIRSWSMRPRVFVVLIAAVVACSRSNTSDSTGSADRPDRLTQALQEQVFNSRQTAVPDPKQVRITRVASNAVPDLEYLVADYTPDDMSAHAVFFVFGAARGGDTVVVSHASDLLRFAGDWQPASASQAVTACSEFAVWTSDRKHPRRMPVLFTDRAGLRDAFVAIDDTAAAAKLEAPRSLPVSGAVRVWVVEIGGSHQYECVFAGRPQIRKIGNNSGVLLLNPGS